ncbi:dihydroanticapsin dehydrogenase [Patescibacteria group bacterium]|nr:dihydroanticapsin dehydrogenase [Patescibacteria group bacterium]
MNKRFSNKNIVVTGAATGMGFEMAKCFAEEGGNVVILDINQRALEIAVQILQNQGLNVSAFLMDVTDENAVQTTFKNIAEHFSSVLHVLINNAGIINFDSIEDTDMNTWQRIMAVNATGTYLCSKYALPLLKAQGGAIVNFGSVVALVGIPKMAAYSAAKSAVVGLTKQMAVEYASLGIRVNCVCPGTVADTNMGQQILGTDRSEAAMQKRLQKYPIGRFGHPEEIAATVLFLASDEASFICGAVLAVDGGMTAM